MSQLSVLLQEPEREAQTFLALLRDHMNGTVDSSRRRLRMSLKERLGLKGLGCCGATWGFRATTITNDDLDHEQEDMELVMVNSGQEGTQERVSYPVCLDPTQQYSSVKITVWTQLEYILDESDDDLINKILLSHMPYVICAT
ncbi:hypothetical protein POTOM_040426 [Populus tomentosa]|uniref:Uncharacterized protein n=1 Tax=Populus tomentosa TaxID=118781 RepID=A0A8X7YP22_POPTO|nr:hypothetical protein POTOM_040426 [Populus tomentosa]